MGHGLGPPPPPQPTGAPQPRPPQLSRKPVGFLPLQELFLAADAPWQRVGLRDGHTPALAPWERGWGPPAPCTEVACVSPGALLQPGGPGGPRGPGFGLPRGVWRPETAGVAAVGVQAGRCLRRAGLGAAGLAPVKPAAPPVVVPRRATPVLPVASGWGSWLSALLNRTARGIFFWVCFRGFCNPSPALIQLGGISRAARCAARSRSWRAPGLAEARGTFVLGLRKPRGVEGHISGATELLQSRPGADVGVGVGSDPHRAPSLALATASPYPSMPRTSPAAQPGLFPASPGQHRKTWLGASRLRCTCQSRAPALLLPCRGSRCGSSKADAVVLELLEVPQERWDPPRSRGAPQHPPGIRGGAALQTSS